MNGEPTIFLCDDDDGVRGALSFLLRQHELRVSAHASGPELLATVDAAPKPLRGIFVLDVRMEPMSGPKVHEQLQARGLGKRNPVIFLSGHGDIPMVVGAMARGAFNFVEKPYTDDALVTLIRSALEQEATWHAEAEEVEHLRAEWKGLTPQQKRVAQLVVAGRLNKVIAGEMTLSERTVEVHRAKVFERLGVGSAAELATLLERMRSRGIDLSEIDPAAADKA